MEYIRTLLLIIINYGIAIGSCIYLGNFALGRRIKYKEFLYSYCILYLLFTLPFLFQLKSAILFAYALQIMGLCGILHYYSKNTFVKCMGISGASFIFVYMFIKSFFITDSQSLFNQLIILKSVNLTNIILSLVGDVALIVFIYITRKKKIALLFEQLYRSNNKFITIVIHIFIFIWLITMQLVTKGNAQSQNYESLYLLSFGTFVGGIIVLLLIIALYYRNEGKNELIKMHESTIMQQKNYILTLENLQNEIKKFQHDYKNIVAGLYVSEGTDRNESTIRYIEKNILKFEKNLFESIKETSYLSHIKVEEIKSLMLAKILCSREKGIKLTIEIIRDVYDVFIHVADFNRCLGILVDNGIEAADRSLEKEVHAVMIQENDKFILIVKNTYEGCIRINDIWEEGFSVKGENRGIGLTNYSEIVNKYSNAIKETIVEEDYFVQILKIYIER